MRPLNSPVLHLGLLRTPAIRKSVSLCHRLAIRSVILYRPRLTRTTATSRLPRRMTVLRPNTCDGLYRGLFIIELFSAVLCYVII